jgi:hypothetical protein
MLKFNVFAYRMTTYESQIKLQIVYYKKCYLLFVIRKVTKQITRNKEQIVCLFENLSFAK